MIPQPHPFQVDPDAQSICVVVLAHNEEERIGACLTSLQSEAAGHPVHVVVNGTSDRTAEIARGFAGVTVHDWEQGGKARSWNRIMLDTPSVEADVYVFVDGDAEIAPGSIAALAKAIAVNGVNAAAGVPANGRQAKAYQRSIVAERGLFGDLYALSGAFVRRMRDMGIRLPEDLVGDDSLIGAMAKTNLVSEANWHDERVAACLDAQFFCDPVEMTSKGISMQLGRMKNYSLRYFQNQIVRAIMRTEGPRGLPARMDELYPRYLPQLKARRDVRYWWFDRQALAKMQAAAEALPMSQQSDVAKAA